MSGFTLTAVLPLVTLILEFVMFQADAVIISAVFPRLHLHHISIISHLHYNLRDIPRLMLSSASTSFSFVLDLLTRYVPLHPCFKPCPHFKLFIVNIIRIQEIFQSDLLVFNTPLIFSSALFLCSIFHFTWWYALHIYFPATRSNHPYPQMRYDH